MPAPIHLDEPGRIELLLGNEAIARGAIEASVDVATAYPGTPSTEAMEALVEAAKHLGFYAEWSTNEKVALEVAAGAAYCGARAITTMKHVGLNVAADALMSLAYTGVRGGLVILSADDPFCHSSQNEQDNRYYSLFSLIPCLEPSDVQEAKDMTKRAFSISEEIEIPVLLRSTTRLSHAKGSVVFGEIERRERKFQFEKLKDRFVVLPVNARRLHVELLEKQEKLIEISENSEFNKLFLGDSDTGIIASGISYSYLQDVLRDSGSLERFSILKIGMYPLPRKLVIELLESVERVLVLEELEPIVEREVRALAQMEGIDVEILGKMNSGDVPRYWEFSPDLVARILERKLGVRNPYPSSLRAETEIPPRPPELCPGCPHRGSFYVIRKVAGEDAIFPSDIGCYTLGFNKPFEAVDTCLCMGASVTIPQGIRRALGDEKPIIATIGDSTFLHMGIPGLINAVYNRTRIVLAILDNGTTAMTGLQPHPGTGIRATGEESKRILIEDISRACGAEFVEVVDPFDLEKAMDTLRRALEHDGPAVVIFRRPCAILERRLGIRRKPYTSTEEICRNCEPDIKARVCPVMTLGCPAMRREKGITVIDDSLCNGCGLCARICPNGSLRQVR